MAFPGRFETERLLLRWPTTADAAEMFDRYAQDSEVCRYMSWTTHRSVDETVAFVEWSIEQRQIGSSFTWLVYPRLGGSLLGSIGFRVHKHEVQFGYCLARDTWGHGYATEASWAIVELALSNPAVWRVQAYCDVEHRVSARVLEKAGLTLEGTLRCQVVLPNLGDLPRDVLFYARVRES